MTLFAVLLDQVRQLRRTSRVSDANQVPQQQLGAAEHRSAADYDWCLGCCCLDMSSRERVFPLLLTPDTGERCSKIESRVAFTGPGFQGGKRIQKGMQLVLAHRCD